MEPPGPKMMQILGHLEEENTIEMYFQKYHHSSVRFPPKEIIGNCLNFVDRKISSYIKNRN
jgi:hypothetical protein